jgi:hypothetical protein
MSDPAAGGALAGTAAWGFNARLQPLADSQTAFPGNLLVSGMLSRGHEVAPPGTLILSIRAARRAILADPDDSDGYVILAQAYQNLWGLQEGRLAGGQAPLLEKLRLLQIITALQHALILKPDQPNLHRSLAESYGQMRTETEQPRPYVDLEVYHLQEWLKAVKEAGPGRLQPDQYQDMIKSLEQMVNRRVENLDAIRNDFDFAAERQPPLNRAYEAYKRGLVKLALDELQEADPTQVGRQGQELAIHLLLTTGEVEKAQEAFAPAMNDWQNAQVAAALGDYSKADEHLATLLKRMDDTMAQRLMMVLRMQTFPTELRPENMNEFRQLSTSLQEREDKRVLRAILALEAGNTPLAAQLFQKTFDITYPATLTANLLGRLGASSLAESVAPMFCTTGNVVQFGTRPIAFRYWQVLKAERN